MAQEAAAPSGAFIGYYQENPRTNPEDPVPGAIYLRLPASDGPFSGDMFFTYIGCQSSNLGNVSGMKRGTALTGNWSGTVDDVPQRGMFRGRYDAATDSYTGTYTNAGGKQHRDLNPCIEYYIAPDGTWALFPVERNLPADFEIRLTGNSVRWTSTPGAAGIHITIYDAATLESPKGNAIVWQTLLEPGARAASLRDARLQSGKEYVVSVALIGDAAQRLAYGSKRFTAP